MTTMPMTPLLDRPALVLNRTWLPIRTMTNRNAIGLVAVGSARIIDPVTYEVHDLDSWNAVSRAREMLEEGRIRSEWLALKPLEIILLTAYRGTGRKGVVFSRGNIFKRDRFTCQYCGAQPGIRDLSIDHVVPRSEGGTSTWENCVVACLGCNARKANRTPRGAGLSLLRPPRKPDRKALLGLPTRARCESWKKFLNRAYWDVELEP